ARIVASFFNMPLQGTSISAGTKRSTGASHDNGMDRRITLSLIECPAILSVHPPSPGIHSVRAIERDRGNIVSDGIENDFEVHVSLCPTCEGIVVPPSRRPEAASETPAPQATYANTCRANSSTSATASSFPVRFSQIVA